MPRYHLDNEDSDDEEDEAIDDGSLSLVSYIPFLRSHDKHDSRYGHMYNSQVSDVTMNPNDYDDYSIDNDDSTYHTGYCPPSNQESEERLTDASNQHKIRRRRSFNAGTPIESEIGEFNLIHPESPAPSRESRLLSYINCAAVLIACAFAITGGLGVSMRNDSSNLHWRTGIYRQFLNAKYVANEVYFRSIDFIDELTAASSSNNDPVYRNCHFSIPQNLTGKLQDMITAQDWQVSKIAEIVAEWHEGVGSDKYDRKPLRLLLVGPDSVGKMETALMLSEMLVSHCNSDDDDVDDATISPSGKPSKSVNKTATNNLDGNKIPHVSSSHRKSRKSDKLPENVLVLTPHEYKSPMDDPGIEILRTKIETGSDYPLTSTEKLLQRVVSHVRKNEDQTSSSIVILNGVDQMTVAELSTILVSSDTNTLSCPAAARRRNRFFTGSTIDQHEVSLHNVIFIFVMNFNIDTFKLLNGSNNNNNADKTSRVWLRNTMKTVVEHHFGSKPDTSKMDLEKLFRQIDLAVPFNFLGNYDLDVLLKRQISSTTIAASMQETHQIHLPVYVTNAARQYLLGTQFVDYMNVQTWHSQRSVRYGASSLEEIMRMLRLNLKRHLQGTFYQEIGSAQSGDEGTVGLINYEPDASMVSIGWCNGIRTSNDHDAWGLDKKSLKDSGCREVWRGVFT
eukprot:CAMPEP_0194374646 /NCGR_PEP_ID=MMETSP0174-20130528/23085_1 /TAXON_ID=216777 /ORGANISM="Proboscia alata, Strain PI-D3" /LENGTH=676 /DNA_ID=CAMNT_0039154349 /DNA_START=21 /DNA_END=2051 /DNA_ORIENTATION=-